MIHDLRDTSIRCQQIMPHQSPRGVSCQQRCRNFKTVSVIESHVFWPGSVTLYYHGDEDIAVSNTRCHAACVHIAETRELHLFISRKQLPVFVLSTSVANNNPILQ